MGRIPVLFAGSSVGVLTVLRHGGDLGTELPTDMVWHWRFRWLYMGIAAMVLHRKRYGRLDRYSYVPHRKRFVLYN